MRIYEWRKFTTADDANTYHYTSRSQSSNTDPPQTKPLIITENTDTAPSEGNYYWTQLGEDIDSEANGDYSGHSVVLSSDGTIVAIGAWGNNGNDEENTNRGHVRIYQQDASNTNVAPIGWKKLGSDIDGEAADDWSGYSVALSDDGTIVAIGAIYNDGNGADSGHVRIYQWLNGVWNKLGEDIDGEAANNYSGISVALSSDGTIVAIGAPYNNGTNTGHVRIYQRIGFTWTQLGEDIDGEAAYDYSGWSVALSSDGTIVAIGAIYNDGNDITDSKKGHVRIYEWSDNAWTKLGSDIDGEAAGDWSGSSVALSNNGTIVAIGAIYNDGKGTDSGHVRIYQIDENILVLPNVKSGNITPANGGGVTLPDNYTLTNGVIIGPYVDLTDVDLTGVDLTGVKSGGIIGEPTLPANYTLTNGYIIGPGVDLTDVDLTGADLTGVKSGGIIGEPTNIPDNYTLTNGFIIGPDVDLTGTDLTGINLTGVDLTGVKSGEITGTPTLPANYILIKGYIIGPSVDLTDADLRGTDLTDVKSGGIVGTPTLPTNYILTNGYIIGPGIDLTGTDLTGVDLTGADLTGVKSGGIIGIPTLPANYTLINGVIIGPGVDLTDTTITGVVSIEQLGLDIDGEALFDESGYSVALSSDGTTVAIGAVKNDEKGFNSGHVRIYKWSDNAWSQLGLDIDGEAANDQSGYSVALSSNGTIVAIGTPINDNKGHVRIYKWDEITTTWNQLGEDIDGEADSDWCGSSVSLSDDGTIVAIGSDENDSPNGDDSGHVRIYEWNGTTTWNKLGSNIDGEAAGDYSGHSVTLSSDGTIVAIGAHGNDKNGNMAGHVRIYKWSGIAWIQRGDDIDGEAANDWSGAKISLSSDGTIVAIGAVYNDGNGDTSGHVRIYKWSGNAWIQRGDDIDGKAGDGSGKSVSLSSDGTIVAIGAIYNNDNGTNSGRVRVYKWDGSAWFQEGLDINGEAAGWYSGWSVALSSNGNIVAIGAMGGDVVRIYQIDENLLLLPNVKSGNITPANGGGVTLPDNYTLTNGVIIGPDVDLTDADLRGTDLTDVKSGGITGIPTLPANYILTNGFIIGPGVDLRGTDLTGVNLDGVTLTGVKSGEITGIPTLPTNYTLTNGYIIGPGVVLTGADLTGADLTGADLTGVKSGGIIGEPTNIPDNYTLTNGFIIGPDVDLTDADLTGIDLTDADLRNVNLTGTKSGEIIPTDGNGVMLPVGYKIVSGYILGPGVDLSGVDLSLFDLSGIDFTNANLTKVDMYGADLTNVSFINTTLTNARLENAITTGITSRNIIQATSLVNSFKVTVVGTENIWRDGWINEIGVQEIAMQLIKNPGTSTETIMLDELANNMFLGPPYTAMWQGVPVTTTYNLSVTSATDIYELRWIYPNTYNSVGTKEGRTTMTVTKTNSTWDNTTILTNTSNSKTGAPPASDTNGVELIVYDNKTTLLHTRFSISKNTGWTSKLINGYFLDVGAIVVGALLSNTNLEGLKLKEATLIDADLSGTDLTNVDLSGADLRNAILTNANLIKC